MSFVGLGVGLGGVSAQRLLGIGSGWCKKKASFLDMSPVTQRVLGPAHKIALRALIDARKEVLSKL